MINLLRPWFIAILYCAGLCFTAPCSAAHLAMGFRVGEVKQTSVLIWSRVTATPERNWKGYRDPKKREPRVAEYTLSPIAVSDRQGNVEGAAGEIRVTFGTKENLSGARSTDWTAVGPQRDFVFKQKIDGLQPGTRYFVRVDARDDKDSPISASTTGQFMTAQQPDKWQHVKFSVVTGQSYWDLDHERGYHMYPAMGKQELNFMVATGDTVYLDSESPRARTVELARYHWRRMYSLPRLVEFHRNTPGYWEVDDHDSFCNDDWPTMKAKWMAPLTYPQGGRVFREQNPVPEKTYRTIRWGKGLQIWLVEGRDYRTPNNVPDGPEKTIWGKEQLAWIKSTILASDAEFKVLISPTPIVGPDRSGKADNHANQAFAHAGNAFRKWTKDNKLSNFFVCCGDRHWQYYSIDPKSGLREFSCGPASNKHAGGSPKHDPKLQPFHRVKGGYLSVEVHRPEQKPTITFRHHDVHGGVVNTLDFTR